MRSLQVLVGLLPPVLAAVEFVNPPPFGTSGSFYDSSNPSYQEGDILDIAWTGSSDGTTRSLSLLQWQNQSSEMQQTMVDYDFAQGLTADTTTFQWTVRSGSIAPELCVFQLVLDGLEGSTLVSSALSHYFIINRDSETSSTTTSTPTSAATTTASAGTTNSSNGLNTTTIIGISIAISCTVVLGVVATWVVFGKLARQARRTEVQSKKIGSNEAELGVAGALRTSAELSSLGEAAELDRDGELYTPAELSSQRETAELSSERHAAELGTRGESHHTPPDLGVDRGPNGPQ